MVVKLPKVEMSSHSRQGDSNSWSVATVQSEDLERLMYVLQIGEVFEALSSFRCHSNVFVSAWASKVESLQRAQIVLANEGGDMTVHPTSLEKDVVILWFLTYWKSFR